MFELEIVVQLDAIDSDRFKGEQDFFYFILGIITNRYFA